MSEISILPLDQEWLLTNEVDQERLDEYKQQLKESRKKQKVSHTLEPFFARSYDSYFEGEVMEE